VHPSTQGQRHIRLTSTHFSLVRPRTAKLSQDVTKDAIFLLEAKYRDIIRNHVMHCEHISQLNIQRRLDLGVKVVELANVELYFGIRYVNYCAC